MNGVTAASLAIGLFMHGRGRGSEEVVTSVIGAGQRRGPGLVVGSLHAREGRRHAAAVGTRGRSAQRTVDGGVQGTQS